jgi:hypothetical protein
MISARERAQVRTSRRRYSRQSQQLAPKTRRSLHRIRRGSGNRYEPGWARIRSCALGIADAMLEGDYGTGGFMSGGRMRCVVRVPDERARLRAPCRNARERWLFTRRAGFGGGRCRVQHLRGQGERGQQALPSLANLVPVKEANDRGSRSWRGIVCWRARSVASSPDETRCWSGQFAGLDREPVLWSGSRAGHEG